jgi:hypothetical protein
MTVGGQPSQPDVSGVRVLYDTTGAISIIVDFYGPVDGYDSSQNYAYYGNFTVGSWKRYGATLSCSTEAQGSLGSGQHHIYSASSTFFDRATVTGYDGYLNFARALSADKRQITLTASSPTIANRNYQCVTYTTNGRRRSTVENINSRYDENCDCWYVGAPPDTVGQFQFAGQDPPPPPACSDGIDNDGDGNVDFPRDTDCTTSDGNSEGVRPPPRPQCSDGIDNDSDGRTDYPFDTQCRGSEGTSERVVLPPPALFATRPALDYMRVRIIREFGSVPRSLRRYCQRIFRTRIKCRVSFNVLTRDWKRRRCVSQCGWWRFVGESQVWTTRNGERRYYSLKLVGRRIGTRIVRQYVVTVAR